MQASHRWSEDAADRLEVHGPSEQAVFTQAFTALCELFPAADARADALVQRRIEAEADDHRMLLAEWLPASSSCSSSTSASCSTASTASACSTASSRRRSTRGRAIPPHGSRASPTTTRVHRDRAGWRARVVLDI